MFSGLGYALYFLGVFKIAFNEQYEVENMSVEQQQKVQVILSNPKSKERKSEEEAFLKNLWGMVNPKGFEGLD